MSAIGSSVINKSGKKFAPRAAFQRRQGDFPASPRSSARASIDRQVTPSVTVTRGPAPSVTTDAIPSRENLQQVYAEARDASTALPVHPQGPGTSEKQLARTATPTPLEPLLETQINVPSSSALPVSGGASEAISTLSSTPLQVNSPPEVSNQTRHIPARRGAATAELGEGDRAAASEPSAKRQRVRPSALDGVTGRQTRQSNVPPTINTPSTNSATQVQDPAAHANEGRTTRNSEARRTLLATSKGRQPAKARVANRSKTSSKTKTAGSSSATKRRRSKRKGAESEVDEEFQIVPSEVTMADLCEDNGKGKRSTREKRLAELAKQKAEQKRKEREARVTQGDAAAQQSTEGAAGGATGSNARDLDQLDLEPRRRTRAAPGLRWVNGKMIVDDQSLQVDRHADAALEAEELEEVEENDLTRRVTQHVWQKNKKKARWNEETTDRFYLGLRMFGTDFLTISKMFPGFTRHQIKLKFSREEKSAEDRIRESLMGPREPMDLSVLTCNAGVEYEDPREFQKQLDREAAEFTENRKRQKEEAQEIMKQNRINSAAAAAAAAAGNADKNGAGGNANAAEEQAGQKGKQTKKGGKESTKKPKKKMHSRFGGGEEVEVLGFID
ncbi:MAG: Transcription factor TFIIIB component B [Watsoniomyces obsoletus]|nr:MAG: Transcription factor TFIIIB component B [Watsoniomyces obsoletus]